MEPLTHTNGLTFRKMHGAGNDFVVIDRRNGGPSMTPSLAKALGDRNRGVGFDQLAEIIPSEHADCALIFWNSDGTTAGACGNATRCVASVLMDEANVQALEIQTGRGLLVAEKTDTKIWVNMGEPVLDWRDIPLAREMDLLKLPLPGEPMAVGMGNPHCVHFVEDAQSIDLDNVGPKVENDALFPARTNAIFVSKSGPDSLRMRVWERGAGVTLACGSGACAAVVASYLRGETGKNVTLRADGGFLEVDWRDDGVWLTGPVAEVFTATLSPEFFPAI